jgi:general secretion pathway protein G
MLARRDRCAGRTGSAGYTLLELLIVLAILGLIAAFAAPRVIGYFERSKTHAAEIQIADLMGVLDLYRLDTGSYPTADQGLQALLVKPPNAKHWHGPYLTRNDGIIDPWGRPYLYTPPTDGMPPVIMSYGADGKPGGTGQDEDVTSTH